MTTTASSLREGGRPLLLDGVSWDYYERILEQVGSRSLQVTFHRGKLEIISPLPEHDYPKRAIGSLIDILSLELNIPMRRFGSTTFRREDQLAGLEPDECYYLHNESLVRGMRRFDPAVHPAPDLAIEIDITSGSIPREPVYAALGVAELWRYDGRRLSVRLLGAEGNTNRASEARPFRSFRWIGWKRSFFAWRPRSKRRC